MICARGVGNSRPASVSPSRTWPTQPTGEEMSYSEADRRTGGVLHDGEGGWEGGREKGGVEGC